MRRAQAILLITVLLATPLALLARAIPGDQTACNRTCCLSRGPHSTEQAERMSCHHGAAGHALDCTVRSDRHQPDYGPIAPIAPTFLASRVELVAPDLTGPLSRPQAASPASGFLAAPFEPPRA
jgi:hypothetical protein